MSRPRDVTILVIDDHDEARAALVRRLAKVEGVVVAGEAVAPPQAISLAAQLAPDVVVCDTRLGRADGPALVRSLVALKRPPVVVVHTSYLTRAERMRLAEAGAAAFVMKDAGVAGLIECIGALVPVEGRRAT